MTDKKQEKFWLVFPEEEVQVLEALREASRRTGVSQAQLTRDALRRELKRLGFLADEPTTLADEALEGLVATLAVNFERDGVPRRTKLVYQRVQQVLQDTRAELDRFRVHANGS